MNIVQFVKDNENYLKDLITRAIYHSNAIEGNTLTYVETYATIFNDNSFKIEGKSPREIYEAINHKKAIQYMFNNMLDKTYYLNVHDIIKLNEIINRDINNTEGFRKVEVFISGADYIPPKPEKVPNLMNYWLYNYNNSNEDIFFKIAKYHIEFEKIHPFEDGNGRVGRLLIIAELLKNNFPPVIINKENRVEYYEILRKEDFKNFKLFLENISKEEERRLESFGYFTKQNTQIKSDEKDIKK